MKKPSTVVSKTPFQQQQMTTAAAAQAQMTTVAAGQKAQIVSEKQPRKASAASLGKKEEDVGIRNDHIKTFD